MRERVTVRDEDQMKDLGRQARIAGFPLSSCNLRLFDPRRAFWVAGWVDCDNELKPMEGSDDISNNGFDSNSDGD